MAAPALIMAASLALAALPATAQALTTDKCSARPNADAAGDNSVLVAT